MDEIEDALGGFDESDDVFGVFEDHDDFPDPSGAASDSQAPDRWWNLTGDLGLATTFGLHDHDSATGTNYRGLERLRTKLSLQFDATLPAEWKLRTMAYAYYDFNYVIQGRSSYSNGVVDEYEYDVQLTDSYLEGSLHESVDLKIGRQVVNWGRSETLRILDVINPLDSREPGLVDIEESRLSLAMVRLGFFSGPWSLTALLIPEIRFDFLPPTGSDLAPSLPLVLPPTTAIFSRELRPADFSKDMEYALNLTGTFSGWDFSLEAVYFWNDQPNIKSIVVTSDVDITLEHARLWLLGAGANYTMGSWLFKAEFAFLEGFQFASTNEEKSRVDAMMGIEFYGIHDLSIVFEVAHRHINDFEKGMKSLPDLAEEDILESALRVRWDLFNQQLHLTAVAVVLGETAQNGSFIRLSAEYDVMDALSVECGFLLFQDGDNLFFRNSDKNDRFFAGARYSF